MGFIHEFEVEILKQLYSSVGGFEKSLPRPLKKTWSKEGFYKGKNMLLHHDLLAVDNVNTLLAGVIHLHA